MDGQTNGRMVRWMENLPNLQDFDLYRGRHPAIAQLQPKNYIKRGKGTADHMMLLGNWFPLSLLEFLTHSLSPSLQAPAFEPQPLSPSLQAAISKPPPPRPRL